MFSEKVDSSKDAVKKVKEKRLNTNKIYVIILSIVVLFSIAYKYVLPKFSIEQRKISENLVVFEKKGKYGIVDGDKNIILNPEYNEIRDFYDGVAIYRKGSLHGYIDEDGNIGFELDFDDLRNFSEGLAIFRQEGLYGCVNKYGDIVLEARFDEIGDFSEGRAVYKVDGLSGIIDSEGNVITEPVYQYINKFSEGLAAAEARDGSNWVGYLDKDGNRVLGSGNDFTFTNSFYKGVAEVSIGEKTAIIDKSGRFIIEPIFNTIDIEEFYQALENENILITVSEEVGYNSDNYKSGLIDIKGNIIIEPRFDEVFNSISEGMIIVGNDYKYGYVDINDNIVIDIKFDEAYEFKDGKAKVSIDGKERYIDNNGNFIKK